MDRGESDRVKDIIRIYLAILWLVLVAISGVMELRVGDPHLSCKNIEELLGFGMAEEMPFG